MGAGLERARRRRLLRQAGVSTGVLLPSTRHLAAWALALALIAIAPLAVATWVVGKSFKTTELERLDVRLTTSLSATRDALVPLTGRAAQWAVRAASSRRLQLELEAGRSSQAVADHGLLRLYVTPAGEGSRSRTPAVSHVVTVRRGGRSLGTVEGAVPLDRALLVELRRRVKLPNSIQLALVRDGVVVAGFEKHAELAVSPSPADALVEGTRFRAAGLELDPREHVLLAALAPREAVDAAVRRRQEWVLGAGLSTIATALLVIAVLRRERLLGWPTSEQRQIHSLALVGDAFAATRDAEALYPVILRTALAATRARRAALFWNGEEVAATEARPRGNAETFALRNASGSGELVLSAPPGGFRRSDRELVHSLVRQAEIALESARLHRVVQQQAVTDELTDLANRRRFQQALEAEIRRARRFGGSVGLLLVDLDNFKQINDRFGHQLGDRVLVATADALRRRIRDTDLAARMGGDEFALLLPHTDLAGSLALAQGVRAEIEAAGGATPTSGLTASVGVAVYPDAGTADELIEAADRALYLAKARGRNRVAAAGEEGGGE
jgi:diguanylate cyclase (GGDEF)-like protein